MQSGCQSNDVKSNALATIARAEKSDVTKIQREAIGMWGSRLSVRYRSKRTYANATLMGASQPVPGGDSQILRAGISRAAEDEEGPSNALPC